MATGGQIVGANLTLGASYDSGNIAVANDLVAATKVLLEDIIDSGAALSAIDLDLLQIQEGRTNAFGSAATPIAVVADRMDIAGAGGVFINCGAGALVTDSLRVRMDNAGARAVFGSAGTSTWKEMDFDRGNVEFAGSSLFHASAVMRIGSLGGQNDVALKIAASAATLPKLDQASGLATIDNTLTLLNMLATSKCIKDEAPVTQAFIGAGCELVYNHKVLTGETTKIVVFPGGMLNLMGNTEPKHLDDVHIKKGGNIRWLDDPKMHIIDTFRNDNRQ